MRRCARATTGKDDETRCPTPQTNLKHARCVGTDDAEDGARGERA
jgi:hypothetical protein